MTLNYQGPLQMRNYGAPFANYDIDMRRRTFLKTGLGIPAVLGIAGGSAAPLLARGKAEKLVKIMEFTNAGQAERVVQVEKVEKTDAEWRQQLTPEEYEITRHAGTERAFTGKYWNNHEHGMYRCICCGNALFSSDTKFDSGTGWPSFWAPIAKENVEKRMDISFGMMRTEVRCAQCEAHLGHLFEDGPKPTGLRYCMNSASLNFIKG